MEVEFFTGWTAEAIVAIVVAIVVAVPVATKLASERRRAELAVAIGHRSRQGMGVQHVVQRECRCGVVLGFSQHKRSGAHMESIKRHGAEACYTKECRNGSDCKRWQHCTALKKEDGEQAVGS